MKKIICTFTAIILMFLTLPNKTMAASVNTRDDFRAVWVSSVVNLDFPSKSGISADDMKKEINEIIERASDIGFNAIVLQVRPCADALYKSDIFPWSEYLTGTQGQAISDGFDPLAFWIEKCHAKGIELHAWINPYRISLATSKKTNVNELSSTNPARLNPSWVVKYNGAMYFDPGIPECRELIIKGVTEIINNYNVDGIHLDDYFYPGPDFADGETYKKYGNGTKLDDWRRENVNILIKGIQAKVRELNPNVRFGISPFAIWQNKSSNELGSDTKGFEAYKSIYSDTRKWVKEGWVDYICPQIYWYIGYDVADYQKLLNWWTAVCEGTGVDLYVGHAAYKEAQNDSGWKGEMIRQLKMNEKNKLVKGSIFFRASNLKDKLGNDLKAYYAGKEVSAAPSDIIASSEPAPAAPVTQPNPSAPSAPVQPNASAPAENTTSVPATPPDLSAPVVQTGTNIVMNKLTVAQPAGNITISSAKGYTIFGTCVPDKDLFVNGQKITNRTPEGFFSAYVELSNGANTFTFTQENQAAVTRVITQKASDNTSPSTTPAVSVTPVDISNKCYAAVTAEYAWVYPKNTTNGGSSWLLKKGQKDLVTAKTSDNKWVKLQSGTWIETQNVNLSYENNIITNVLSNGVYEQSVNYDMIKWQASAYPAVNVNYDGSKLDIYFGMQSDVPAIKFSETGSLDNTIFSGVSSGVSDSSAYYSFKLRDGVKFEGYYADYKDGEFRINLKKRKSITNNDLPLSGVKIVIDAGHGGDQTGAIGPMGKDMPEKTINLKNSLKLAERLKAKGADVIMVRETDVDYQLYERTEISRAYNPDMFISIHANSIAETTNSASIRGLTVWYRNDLSAVLSDFLANKLAKINPDTTRSQVSYFSNLYVCRPAWTPSVIIEASFMCNINDFSWMINEKNQNELADAIANAIIDYYK